MSKIKSRPLTQITNFCLQYPFLGVNDFNIESSKRVTAKCKHLVSLVAEQIWFVSPFNEQKLKREKNKIEMNFHFVRNDCRKTIDIYADLFCLEMCPLAFDAIAIRTYHQRIVFVFILDSFSDSLAFTCMPFSSEIKILCSMCFFFRCCCSSVRFNTT